ncbi:hypothetical protein niasHT_024396 [Heterodera trifolii]|uniref:Uncharacterized protein n=1 Tax=Heterodera trifolii TaxID=157864 RepID=A0ABD2JY50_9BILA
MSLLASNNSSSNGTNAAATAPMSPPASYKEQQQKHKFKKPSPLDRFLYKVVPAQTHPFTQLCYTTLILGLWAQLGRFVR